MPSVINSGCQRVLAVGLATAALSSIGFYNGFPLVFWDTAIYLATAIDLLESGWLSVPWSRPPFYSFILLSLHMKVSLWPVVVAQALMTAHVLFLVMRVTLGRVSPFHYILTVTVLTVFTSLPWFASQITPDIFTPVVILGMYLLGFAVDRMSWAEILYVLCLTTLATVVHYSHLPLAAGLAVALGWWSQPRGQLSRMGAMRTAADDMKGRPMHGASLPAASPPFRPSRQRTLIGVSLLGAPAVIATIAMVGANYIGRGEVAAVPYARIFLLARAISDGPAKKYLEEHCAARKYALCEYIDQLDRGSNAFLWSEESPLYKIGVKQVRQEADEIVKRSLLSYPLWSLRIAGGHLLHQLVRFETGDWLRPFLDNTSVDTAIARYFPHSYSAYRSSRQSMGELPLQRWSFVHLAAALVSLVVLAFAMVWMVRRYYYYRLLVLSSTIVLGLIGNAAICGPLAIVTNRYQSRLIWLTTFAVMLFVVAAIKARSPAPPRL
jgi:hypothetical protein